MKEFATIFDDPKRKTSMLTFKGEGEREVNTEGLGLQSFMTKTIIEEQQSSMNSAMAMHRDKAKKVEDTLEA